MTAGDALMESTKPTESESCHFIFAKAVKVRGVTPLQQHSRWVVAIRLQQIATGKCGLCNSSPKKPTAHIRLANFVQQDMS